MTDRSNGYESLAAMFAPGRSPVGLARVLAWARNLPPGGAVLDLGCGPGIPMAKALAEQGLSVYGVDASPGMTAHFRQHVPQGHVACEPAEESTFFNRTFDGVLAWGLLFLLPSTTQLALLTRIAQVLVPGGRLLFTSPWQVCTWNDNLTGTPSESPGGDVYRATLSAAGLTVLDEYDDEGENHYYDAIKC